MDSTRVDPHLKLIEIPQPASVDRHVSRGLGRQFGKIVQNARSTQRPSSHSRAHRIDSMHLEDLLR
jgi:hypothetical protein